MTDWSVFTQAVRNYEAFLFEYANKKKYKIKIIKHSKNNETFTEFLLKKTFEDPDKILQSINNIHLIEKQFDKNKQFLQTQKQNALDKYFNYFNNCVD